MFFSVFLPAIVALILNVVFLPLILMLSHRYKWYDPKDHRKVHTTDIPRLGGVGIFAAFFIPVILLRILSLFIPEIGISQRFERFLPMIIGILTIHLMGLIDDFIDLKAVYKFIIQIIAAVLVMLGGYLIKSLRLPFTDSILPFGWFAYPLTLLWIVGIANAVNFIDGIDGLAGGFGVIASLFMGIVSVITGETTAAVLSFALCGSLAAFLFFNFPPAKIFMGDSGSLFIGFVLAIIPLTMESGRTAGFGLTPAITLLFLPILDTIAAVFRRIKRGVPIYRADKQHTHHKLMEAGFSPRGILGILYSICIFLGATAMLWPVLSRNNAFIVNIFVWLICIAALIVLDRTNKTIYPENGE